MRYFGLLFILTMIVVISGLTSPAMARDHKDGYQEPRVTQPAQPSTEVKTEPPIYDEVEPVEVEEEMGPSVEGPEEPAPEKKCARFNKKKNYFEHMDFLALDAAATDFMGGVRVVAILPFIDLSNPTLFGKSMMDQAGGPRRIADGLAAALMEKGYLVVPTTQAEAALKEYLLMRPGGVSISPEIQNNKFYFDNMPSRAMDFYFKVVPGLKSQSKNEGQMDIFLSRDDIKNIADMLGADCIIRGYVQEYAVAERIDNDFRTLMFPFIGIFKPEHWATAKASFYMYNGKNGKPVWNGTIETFNVAQWPMFQSDSDLFKKSNNELVWGMAGRVTPDWEDVVMNHPEWLTYYCEEMAESMCSKPEEAGSCVNCTGTCKAGN